MDKSCNICDFENVCLDEPADANKCNSFRNIDFTKMENAIKIIEESEWLKEHDAEVIREFLRDIAHPQMKRATDEFIKSLNKTDKEFVEDFLEQLKEQK